MTTAFIIVLVVYLILDGLAFWGLHLRIKDLESRDWPQKVVEWRTVRPVNCRCQLTPGLDEAVKERQ